MTRNQIMAREAADADAVNFSDWFDVSSQFSVGRRPFATESFFEVHCQETFN